MTVVLERMTVRNKSLPDDGIAQLQPCQVGGIGIGAHPDCRSKQLEVLMARDAHTAAWS